MRKYFESLVVNIRLISPYVRSFFDTYFQLVYFGVNLMYTVILHTL